MTQEQWSAHVKMMVALMQQLNPSCGAATEIYFALADEENDSIVPEWLNKAMSEEVTSGEFYKPDVEDEPVDCPRCKNTENLTLYTWVVGSLVFVRCNYCYEEGIFTDGPSKSTDEKAWDAWDKKMRSRNT